jgi:hypothetical protein
MKRTDLTVGQDYLYSPRTDWLAYGHSSLRATVLDDRPWQERKYRTRMGTHTLPTGETVDVYGDPSTHGGSGVLVRTEPEPYFEKGRVLVVPASHLRAPYDDGKAQQAAAEEARKARQAREREQAAALRTVRQARIDRVHAATGTSTYIGTTDYGSYILDTNTLDRLLALAEFATTDPTDADHGARFDV